MRTEQESLVPCRQPSVHVMFTLKGCRNMEHERVLTEWCTWRSSLSLYLRWYSAASRDLPHCQGSSWSTRPGASTNKDGKESHCQITVFLRGRSIYFSSVLLLGSHLQYLLLHTYVDRTGLKHFSTSEMIDSLRVWMWTRIRITMKKRLYLRRNRRFNVHNRN